MKHPLIGVNTDVTIHQDGTLLHSLRSPYAEAVWRAGGRPILLPAAPAGNVPADNVSVSLEGLDGLLMTGGDDLDPKFYGGNRRHPEEVPLHVLREEFDLDLVKAAVAMSLPLFCICLGLQELAVAFEGSIHQYIPDSVPGALPHRSEDREGTRHEILLAKDSFLRSILGPRAEVNSLHRQAVAGPGRGQSVAARAPDGVIEALETDGSGFVVGVQWHPELILDEPGQLAIFKGFIEASRRGSPK